MSTKKPIGVSTGMKTFARLIASTAAGIIEIYGFHPLDTVVKRLQMDKSTGPRTLSSLNATIFRDAKDKGIVEKYSSLFPGFGFAVTYKILQRAYKFGGQPIVRDAVDRTFGGFFSRIAGPSRKGLLCEAVAGSLVGAGEVILLPLDALKVKLQASPDAAKKGVLGIVREEGLSNLYRGSLWTIARNVPGSFALFGANALIKEKVFGLTGDKRKKATLFQHFVASLVGSTASILVSSPMDTIKTRIQVEGNQSVSKLLREEGVMSLWKGTTMKLIMNAPKLVFTMTFSGWLASKIESMVLRK